jgi:type VI secretion system protein ImpK
MPVPGGRVPPARPPSMDQTDAMGPAPVASGLNPLVIAANPLLNAIPQLRASVQHPNPAALRDSLVRGVREFEARARAAGATTESVIPARYALCTFIDESAGSTPWGASGQWAQQGLLALFHGEVEGGEKFFQILARLAENPQANLDVLELMYVCLQLGFEGRYRIIDGGRDQLEAIRHRLLSIIRKQRGEYERDLSGNWRGVPAAQRRLGWVSVWVVGAVTALLLVGIYLAFKISLSGTSDAVAAQIAGMRLATPVPPKPKPAPEPRLAPFLAEELQRGLVRVDDLPDRSVVTILGDGLFKPGEVTVAREDQGLLSRIADALTKVRGQIDVVGHTDNQPIRSLRFPSNWELSKARAQSVVNMLAPQVSRERIRADGLGESEPIAPNDSAEGRARNRRVEIVLHVPAGGSDEAAPSAPVRRP